MDDEEKNEDLELTPEEQKAEEELTKEVNDDDLRSEVAEKYGIDPDDEDQAEFLDKIVNNEKTHREKLSTAIKQKIKYREKLKGTSEKSKDNPERSKSSKQEGAQDPAEIARQVFREERDNEALANLNMPDELKAEVKDLAKSKGISIREAEQLPYIQYRKKEIEQEERVKNASPKRSNKGSYAPSYDPSKPLNPDDFDLNAEEGRKAWKEAKASRAKYNAQNN